MSTDLVSGRVLSDNIPLTVQSFSAQLNGSGSLTGSLNLQQLAETAAVAGAANPYAVNAPFIAALTSRRAVLWVLQDNYPVWAGVVWDRPDMTRANGGPLAISAQTLDSVFSHRLITDTIEYGAAGATVDLFTVFLDLVSYGQTKQSGFISPVSPAATRSPAYLAMVAANGKIANLVLPSGAAAISGQTWTAGYTWSDNSQVSSAWSDMVSAGNFEYAFVPGLDSQGNLAVFVQLGYTQLGRPAALSGYSVTYGSGGNALDYGWQETGSTGANFVIATAPPNGSAEQWQSQYPHGADLLDLGAGFPLMESTVSWNGSVVTSQAQVNGFADGEVALYTQSQTTPTVNVAGDRNPALKDLVLGDGFWFSATSPRHPANPDGSPGLQAELRLTGWTAYPPGPSQSQYVQLVASPVTQT